MATAQRMPILLWPLVGVWRLITFFANAIGILLTLLIGFVLMVVGLVLTWTVIFSIVGIPLFIIGVLLIVRGLY